MWKTPEGFSTMSQRLNLHEENIYLLGQRDRVQEDQQPRYRSRYRDLVRNEVQERLRDHRTFGYPIEPLNPPKEFLRKRSKSAAPSATDRKVDQHNHFRVKAPLEDWGGKIVHNQINHLRENIRRVESAQPRRLQSGGGPKCVDNRKGDFFPLNKSGLLPNYVLQPKFGRVPGYLRTRKRELELWTQMDQQKKRPEVEGPRIISDSERMELLRGLRSNWDALQKIYKGLPLLTDTIPKKAYKTKLENELKQIEKDMLLLENNLIAICDD